MSEIEWGLVAIAVLMVCTAWARSMAEKEREWAEQFRHGELMALLQKIHDRLP